MGNAQVVALLLRVVVGVTMIAHGTGSAQIMPAPPAGSRHRFPACPVSPARPPRTPDPRACPRP